MTQRFILHPGDCLEVLDTLDENSIDAVVTDPPYELGFMGKKWDSSGVAFRVETWAKVLRVLKPGGHLLAFGGTRTYHRMACAIEDAGFEIREMHAWVFGSGMPKSLDVSKAIDKAAGAEREVVGSKLGQPGYSLKENDTDYHDRKAYGRFTDAEAECAITAPATEAAKQWEGWGTATKPAMEPVCLARKPLSEKTVAANVLRWGTGALNIDATRIEPTGEGRERVGEASQERRYTEKGATNFAATPGPRGGSPAGRWPASLYHDGSDEVLALFPQSKGQQGDVRGTEKSRTGDENAVCYGEYGRVAFSKRSDSGSAARFFYSPKAGKADRFDSRHPTVKPVALMRWLVRLVTPPGGTVLDPFAGTGTTGQAAIEEGFNAVLIEREEEYRADILRRMNAVLAECDPDYPF
jgi:DNA modification methylase